MKSENVPDVSRSCLKGMKVGLNDLHPVFDGCMMKYFFHLNHNVSFVTIKNNFHFNIIQ